MIPKIKGTQDFLDLSLLQFIIKTSAEQLSLHNFNQIDLPILESSDLFKRTVGNETDIVNKEMFMIEPRAGSNETICLRPEATAQTMRAFLENNIQTTPWKVFSYGAMFRYERPQRGRYRQFQQCNIEVINTESIDQDVLLISLLDQLFSLKWHLENYTLLLNFLGCSQDRLDFRTILTDFLKKQPQICDTCHKRTNANALRVFDCKNETCQEIYRNAPKILEHLCDNCNSEWRQLKNHLELLKINFTIQPLLVRGLDYYNKTVFEFTSTALGAQSSFCGGGRYELATQLGHKTQIPAIGAAFGVDRVLLILETLREKLPITPKPALNIIIPFSATQNPTALLLGQFLTQHGIATDLILEQGSIKSKMRKAHKLNPKYCVLIGENEQALNSVMLKNMLTGDERLVKQADLIECLKN